MYLTYDVADYFANITNLTNKKILDYGCNHANFLCFGFQGDYTGLDIDKTIIERNKQQYPQYNWIYYNEQNNQYNPTINEIAAWPLNENYDVICAFSVFTHCSFEYKRKVINKLKSHLNNKGKLLVTYIDINDKRAITEWYNYRSDLLINLNLDRLLNKELNKCNTATIAVNYHNKKVTIFKDSLTLPTFNEPTYFITFYNRIWLEKQFNSKTVDVTHNYHDIRGLQKCLVIE